MGYADMEQLFDRPEAPPHWWALRKPQSARQAFSADCGWPKLVRNVATSERRAAAGPQKICRGEILQARRTTRRTPAPTLPNLTNSTLACR